jgi:hypothetical protein
MLWRGLFNMKTILLIIALTLTCSCAVLKPATSLQQKKEVKIEAVDEKLAEESRALTTGALDALAYAPTNKPTDLAKKFLQIDQQIEGVPAVRIDVAGILATNKAAIEALEKRIEIQQEWIEERAELRIQLDQANEKLLELGKLYEQERAKSTWKRIWSWTMGTFGIGGLIAIVIFFPAALPIIGAAASFIVSKIPAVVNLLGLVGKSAFDAAVKGVGNARKKLKLTSETNPNKSYTAKEVLSLLDNELKEATEVGDANFKRLIESRRKMLNV